MKTIDRIYISIMFMALFSRVSSDTPWYIPASLGVWIVVEMGYEFSKAMKDKETS